MEASHTSGVFNYKKHASPGKKKGVKEKHNKMLHHHQSAVFVIAMAVSACHALIFPVTHASTVDKLQIFICKVWLLIDLF